MFTGFVVGFCPDMDSGQSLNCQPGPATNTATTRSLCAHYRHSKTGASLPVLGLHRRNVVDARECERLCALLALNEDLHPLRHTASTLSTTYLRGLLLSLALEFGGRHKMALLQELLHVEQRDERLVAGRHNDDGFLPGPSGQIDWRNVPPWHSKTWMRQAPQQPDWRRTAHGSGTARPKRMLVPWKLPPAPPPGTLTGCWSPSCRC